MSRLTLTAALVAAIVSSAPFGASAQMYRRGPYGGASHDGCRQDGSASRHDDRGRYRSGRSDHAGHGRRGLIVARRHVVRLETATDGFVRTFDRALDRSRLDGSRREDVLNARAKALEATADGLKDRLADGRAAERLIERLFDQARALDRFVDRGRLDRPAERDWLRVTRELDALARIFRVGDWREGADGRDRGGHGGRQDENRGHRSRARG